MTIIVDSINGMPWGRPLTHVMKEGLKGLCPFIANSDSSASVVLEGFVGRIKAAVLHALPKSVLHQTGQAVLGHSFRACVSPSTSTGSGVAAAKHAGFNRYGFAASAKACPVSALSHAPLGRFGASNNGQLSESLAS